MGQDIEGRIGNLYRISLSITVELERLMVEMGQLPADKRRVMTRAEMRQKRGALQTPRDVLECGRVPPG